MDDIKSVIQRSKNKVKSKYFRISKDKYSETYSIEEYFGLIMPSNKMGNEGWFRHTYLENFITEDYPIFNLKDFSSEDGIRIIKKVKQEDKLKNELLEYSNYFLMNKNLYGCIKTFKLFLNVLKVDYKKYDKLSELVDYLIKLLNSLSISQLDKSNYIIKLNTILNDLYIQIESLRIEDARTFLNEKYKYLFFLVNEGE